jgi:superfamily I DNA/RNA helicase
MQLNEEQTLAVQHPIGQPACLIAGAGSGKTRVLTERVRWLMSQGVPPKRICAITFTNKAADELVSRLGIEAHTPRDLTPRVSTIHSLSLSAIRRNPTGFGLQEKVTPLDDYDQYMMMKKIIERVKSEENPKRVLEMIDFHRARGYGFSPEYTAAVHKQAQAMHGGYHAMEQSTVGLWKLYETEKTKNSVVDFDDMLHLVLRRAENDYAWLTKLEKMYEFVLMDEAQDTNPTQWKFVNLLLAPGNPNLYVVGDMSQSIYGFNGAVPQILKDYSEEWRGLHPDLYRIARNHRSVPEIVSLANAIQRKMTRTIPLKMESWRGINGEHGVTKTLKACFALDIAGSIAQEIYQSNTLKTKHIAYKDNAILVRSAMQVRDVEGALVRLRIPYIVRGGRGLLQTEEIKDILSYLRLAANVNDFMALVRAVSIPRRGIGDVALERIREYADMNCNGDLILAMKGNLKLSLFADSVRAIREHESAPVKALKTCLSETGYEKYITEKYIKKHEAEKAATKADNIERFRVMVAGLVEENPAMTLGDMVFQLTIDRQSEDDETGKVVISTIHSAKGLEWKRVYVTNINEGSLPHQFSMGNEEEIEEERRLFYVACTRARDTLVLCIPSMVQKGPNTYPLTPSRFLYEIGIS